MYSLIENLNESIPEIPADSIVSRTIYQDENAKVILFGFAAGQELSEHTASKPAILHFLEGDVDLTLGEDIYHVQTGAWVHMRPNLPHSVVAKTQVTMLLMLLQ
jgi:quercetin dioxygenase-like cupin family protein